MVVDPVTSPYIIRCNEMQYYIIAEKVMYMEVGSFYKALMSILALYYVYDLVYPKQCQNTLLFLEKFIFEISSGPKLSGAALATVTDIKNR